MKNPEPHRIGHAGLDGEYPPNTLLGIRAAANSMDSIEVDVRQCRSGEVVLYHDADLETGTGYQGRVSTTDWETLRTLTIHDSEQHIPLLEEAIQAVSPAVGFNLELKETDLISPVRSAVKGTDSPLLVSSFLSEVLAEVRSHNWCVDTALLFEAEPSANIERASELDCTHVHPHFELCLTTDVISRAHQARFRVNSWTVRDAETAQSLCEEGVDGLILGRTSLI